jgi:SAM-dependent methyltransferase
VLDAGCGPGICSEHLARHGATVHAFDITPEMVALARARCAGLAVEVAQGDLAAPLDWLPERAFDKILCSLAFDYARSRRAAAEFARRAAGRDAGVLDGASDARLDGRAYARRRHVRNEPVRLPLVGFRRTETLCQRGAGRWPRS